MKLKNLFAMTLAVLCAVACSKEDNPKTPEQEAAEAIQGSYSGLMAMSVSGTSAGESEMTIQISAEDNGTVTVAFPALGAGSMQLGAFNITDVTVSAADNGSYTFSKESFEATAGDITITGSNLSGTISNGEARITMDIKPGSMPMSITCTFDTQAEPTPETVLADKIVGEYTGLMDMSIAGSSQGSSEMTLALAAADDGTLTISVPAMGDGAMAMPAFDITGVNVSESENGDGIHRTDRKPDACGKRPDRNHKRRTDEADHEHQTGSHAYGNHLHVRHTSTETLPGRNRCRGIYRNDGHERNGKFTRQL